MTSPLRNKQSITTCVDGFVSKCGGSGPNEERELYVTQMDILSDLEPYKEEDEIFYNAMKSAVTQNFKGYKEKVKYISSHE